MAVGQNSFAGPLILLNQEPHVSVDGMLTHDSFILLPRNSRASSNTPPQPLLQVPLTSISTVRSTPSCPNSFSVTLDSAQSCHLQSPSKKEMNRWLFEFQRSLSHLLKKRLSDVRSTTATATASPRPYFRRSPPTTPTPSFQASNISTGIDAAPVSQSLQADSGFAVFRQRQQQTARSPAKSVDGMSADLGLTAFAQSPTSTLSSSALSHGHGRHFRGRRRSGGGGTYSNSQTPTRPQPSSSYVTSPFPSPQPSSSFRDAESPPFVERSTSMFNPSVNIPPPPFSSSPTDADSSPSNAIFEMSMDELDMEFLPKPMLQTTNSNPSTPSVPSTFTMSHQDNGTLLQFHHPQHATSSSPMPPPSPEPPSNIGSTSNQGVRSSQEDRHVVINFTSASGADITLCGIFDGHCGDQASEFCVTNLFRVFNSCLEVQSTLVNVVKATFTQLDHEFCTIAKENGWESGTTGIIVVMHGDKLICGNVGDCRAVVGRVYDLTSEDKWTHITVNPPQHPPPQPSSFTAISPPPINYSFIDVAPIHKASMPEEEKRILNSNGWVTRESDISIGHLNRLDLNDPDVIHIIERNLAQQTSGNNNNPGRLVEIDRVCGELAVSRSLGDLDFKGAYQDKDSEGWWVGPNFLPYAQDHSGKFRGDLVTSEADVTECTIRPHDYIALCCDGITDVMELEDVARITSNLLYQQSATAQTVSGRLVELALQLGSSDNCTVIVVKVESER
ncbi:hypothetical protein TrCOL_g6557 [Triparma columacea]|uniref:protein-serine/threonine phosphatase n=1 Tax=Triparma columacea TaxID=722753 RepID=A0A9W7GHC1_9STRA|nr:hypothetical protein TrCOL_g6557 [Triparma columacea]